MGRRFNFLWFVVVGLTLAGCGREVVVMDEAGKPVEGARVGVQTMSMDGAPVVTDGTGKASVPDRIGVQEVKWVTVSKPGYERAYVNVGQGDVTVKLVEADGKKKGAGDGISR